MGVRFMKNYMKVATVKCCCGKATPYFNPVTEEIEANKYSCVSCEKDETITTMRYKVQAKVADHTGSTSFLLFDREVIQFIYKSAYELLEQQVQREIPQELMDLEGRKIIWIICVKGTEKNYRQPSFNVVKLSDKPDVIHNFHTNMTMEVRTQSELPLSSSSCSGMQVKDSYEFVENISSEAKNNGSPCSPLTPITKRQGSLIIDDEAIQESSTRSKRTYKKARGESDSKVENMKKESTKAKH
ncbi:hypothetical protein YC2023_119152 [Brassica napus]